MNVLTFSLSLSLLLLSLSGAHSFCESLQHLPEGVWECNTTLVIHAVDSVGNCDVDLSDYISGCVLLQATNTYNSTFATLTYSNYVCNDPLLCDATPDFPLCDPGETVVDTSIVWTNSECTEYTSLGAGFVPSVCKYASSASGLGRLVAGVIGCVAVLLWM